MTQHQEQAEQAIRLSRRVFDPPVRRQAWVYILFRDDEIIYVGWTSDLETRLLAHSRSQRGHHSSFRFTSYTAFEVLPEEAKVWESIYIKKLKPSFNKKPSTPTRVHWRTVCRHNRFQNKQEAESRMGGYWAPDAEGYMDRITLIRGGFYK